MATTEEEMKTPLFGFFNKTPKVNNITIAEPLSPITTLDNKNPQEITVPSDESTLDKQKKVRAIDIRFPVDINEETLIVKLEEEQKKMVKGPDGKMVPDYAADGKGANDLKKGKSDKEEESEDETEEKKSDEEGKEKKKFKPKKGEVPPQFKKNMKESLSRRIRVKIKR